MPDTDPSLFQALAVTVRRGDVNTLQTALTDHGSAAVRPDLDPDELTGS